MCLTIEAKGTDVKVRFSFFSSYLYHGEHNGGNPNKSPQRHNYPKFGMFGFMAEQFQPYPRTDTAAQPCHPQQHTLPDSKLIPYGSFLINAVQNKRYKIDY